MEYRFSLSFYLYDPKYKKKGLWLSPLAIFDSYWFQNLNRQAESPGTYLLDAAIGASYCFGYLALASSVWLVDVDFCVFFNGGLEVY